MSFLNFAFILHHKRRAIIYALVAAAFIVLIVYGANFFRTIFNSAEAIRLWVKQFGIWAPLALTALEAAQVVIAPLNNFFTNFAAGYLYGPWLGTLYSYVGWIAGAVIVFWFCRLFGRRFVIFFVSAEKLRRFDEIVGRGEYVLFMLFLLPGPPDDLLVYLVGLSGAISFRTFFWMILITKLPGKLATAWLGAGVAGRNLAAGLIYAVFILGSLVIYWRRPDLWQVWKKKP